MNTKTTFPYFGLILLLIGVILILIGSYNKTDEITQLKEKISYLELTKESKNSPKFLITNMITNYDNESFSIMITGKVNE